MNNDYCTPVTARPLTQCNKHITQILVLELVKQTEQETKEIEELAALGVIEEIKLFTCSYRYGQVAWEVDQLLQSLKELMAVITSNPLMKQVSACITLLMRIKNLIPASKETNRERL